MKKSVSLVLCFVMLLFSFENVFPVITQALSEPTINIVENTAQILLEDENSFGNVQLTLKSSNLPEGSVIEWTTDNIKISSVSESGLVTMTSPGSVIITVSASYDEEKWTDICVVTARYNLSYYINDLDTMLRDVESDVDNEPKVYATSALTNLRSVLESIKTGIKLTGTYPTILGLRDAIREKLPTALEDTADNCDLVKRWKTSLRDANTLVDNNILAKSDNVNYWAKWKTAYDKFLLCDTENATEETFQALKDIIDEFESTDWIDNEEYKTKLNALANDLETAISGLKKKTVNLFFEEETISKDVGSQPFTPKFTNDGDDELYWSSSNPDIASVDENGKITIHKGIPKNSSPYVTITIVSKRDKNKKDTLLLEIINPVSSFKLKSTRVVGYVGQKLTLDYSVSGVDPDAPVSNQTVTWTSSNSTLATVSKGVVTPLSAGEVTIKATCGKYESSCKVVIQASRTVSVLREYSFPSTVTQGATVTARVLVLPKDATNKSIKWTSSNEKIATVESTGTDGNSIANAVITGKKEGEVTITCATTDGTNLKTSFTLAVKPVITSLTFDKVQVASYLKNTQVIKIKPTIKPDNAGNQLLTWISADESIVSVVDDGDANGKLQFNRTGRTTVYAYTNDGSDISASCEIIVLGSATALSLNKTSASMKVGGNKLTLICSGIFSSEKEPITSKEYPDAYKWSSSDDSICSVTSEGVVKAKLPGTATITATYGDGKEVTCKIKVTADLKGISLPDNLTLYVGKSKVAPVSFLPEYASNQKVTLKSSDKSVAKVSSDGVISAVGPGTATITATSDEKNSSGKPYVAVCKVTVLQAVTGVDVNYDSKTLYLGKTSTVQLKATVSPSNASNKAVKWTTSNSSVAKVSTSGLVTAKGPGRCKITCKTLDGSYTASCTINVKQPLKSIKFSKTKKTLYENQQSQLKVIYTPSNASNKKVTYSSSNKNIAKVSSDGLITAVDVGKCTITAKSSDGSYKATCSVTVVKKISVKSISLNYSSKQIYKNGVTTLKVSFNPSNTSNKAVKWSSSNSKVATVSEKGVVTGKKGGSCTITCTSEDNKVKATCKIKVYEYPEKVILSSEAITIIMGKEKTLTAKVSPDSSTNKSIKWSTSDEKIATVKDGVVKAKKAGTCYIIAKSAADSSIKKKCKVTVLQIPKKITLNEKTITVYKNETRTIVPSVTPKSSYDKSVTWSSSNRSVVSVNKEGQIRGLKPGTSTITCTSVANPDIYARCVVTVKQKVTGIEISTDSMTLTAGRTKTLTANVLPSTATNKKVIFKTTNKNVATVTSSGVVEAIGPGSCKITAMSDDGFFVATCSVTVIEPVVAVKLSRTSAIYIGLGDTYTLSATIRPSNASNKNVIWKSSNSTVARVSQSGKITALRESNEPVYISVTTVDGGYTAKVKVYCIIKVDAVTLNKTSLGLIKGKTYKLKATVYPSDATFKQVSWSSSNPKVAKVDENGVVTAVGKGTCTITCKTNQGSYKATCTIKVSS